MIDPGAVPGTRTIIVGSSPLALIHAILRQRAGERVTVLEGADEVGGAWATFSDGPLAGHERACHLLEPDEIVHAFLADELGVRLEPHRAPPVVQVGRARVRHGTPAGLWLELADLPGLVGRSATRAMRTRDPQATRLARRDAAFQVLRVLERVRRGGLWRSTTSMNFAGGVDAALRQLVGELERHGGRVLLGHRVERVDATSGLDTDGVAVQYRHRAVGGLVRADRALVTSGLRGCRITIDGVEAVRHCDGQVSHHAVVTVAPAAPTPCYVHFSGRDTIRRVAHLGMNAEGDDLLIVQTRGTPPDHQIIDALRRKGVCGPHSRMEVVERLSYTSTQTTLRPSRSPEPCPVELIDSQGDLAHHLRGLAASYTTTPDRSVSHQSALNATLGVGMVANCD